MGRIAVAAALLIALAVSVSVVAQQGRDIYANPGNLKILAKDISSAELAATMRNFSLGLGVECSHCHDGNDEQSLAEFDFAADVKEPKAVAREMLKMVASINATVTGLNRGPDHQPVEVACVTCHRGQFRPRMIEDVLEATLAEHDGDIDAVIAKYRELREKYYGGFTFDFGEFPVSGFAFGLSGKGRPEDAIKLLQMNAEYHPESPFIQSGIGFIHHDAGRLELAAEGYRRALKLNPDDRWAAGQLREVEKLLAEKQQP